MMKKVKQTDRQKNKTKIKQRTKWNWKKIESKQI